MATRIRLFAAFGALVTAVILVLQSGPLSVPGPGRVPASTCALPGDDTIKWPVVEPSTDPFDACRDIPLDVIRIGLRSPRPTEDGCAATTRENQMAVELRLAHLRESLPPDAVELDIDGHRAAQYWVMKPTDWNNRWWITCTVAFKTD